MNLHAIQPVQTPDDCLTIAGQTYRSRLLVGTGKYRDFAETRAAVDASGTGVLLDTSERQGQVPAGEHLLPQARLGGVSGGTVRRRTVTTL